MVPSQRIRLARLTSIALAVTLMTSLVTHAHATISLGLINDFQDGTAQGWDGGANFPINIANGGPLGAGDRFLQINPNTFFASYNLSISGAVDANVTGFTVDLMAPANNVDTLEMRLVLFGPGISTGTRYTSATPITIPNDGVWRNYYFSLLEPDLSLPGGGDTYANVIADVNRIMFRHDPGTPDFGGTFASAVLGVDNLTAVSIPEPNTPLLLLSAISLATFFRRRR
ncbi:MAG: PEP-CTERM sorting domain-containing protein [Verrucomicrobiota bacterium]